MGELIFPFKAHQIVRSRNDIGVILGILHGDDQLVIRVQWARNVGGAVIRSFTAKEVPNACWRQPLC